MCLFYDISGDQDHLYVEVMLEKLNEVKPSQNTSSLKKAVTFAGPSTDE
jgi:hypothetical protein